MINDWRVKFTAATHGQVDAQFPFGFVQVNLKLNYVCEFETELCVCLLRCLPVVFNLESSLFPI